jgi:hypothetical protein
MSAQAAQQTPQQEQMRTPATFHMKQQQYTSWQLCSCRHLLMLLQLLLGQPLQHHFCN